jgi:protein-S-isoprenylcysteine O-methyltransferase Ste14
MREMDLTANDLQFVALTFGAMVAARILLGFLCLLGGWNALSPQGATARYDRAVLFVLDIVSIVWLPNAVFFAQQLEWFDICFWLSIAGMFELFGWMCVMFAAATKGNGRSAGNIYTSGPYGLIRHPMYAVTCLALLAAALLTGGRDVFLLSGASCAVCLVLVFFEDRMLRREIPLYREYAQHTKFRLIPGVW